MKYLKQVCLILLFSFLGEVCRCLIPLMIPASIYGITLLFASLALKIIRVEDVRETGAFLTSLLPIFAGVLAGVICSAGSVYFLSKLFALPDTILFSLMPKSVTAAIGVPISEEIGGIAALTTAAITITGIIGNIMAPLFCKWFRLKDPVAQGVAIGTSSHVIATARAFEMGELIGAVSSFSLTVAGLVTSFLLSFLAQYL